MSITSNTITPAGTRGRSGTFGALLIAAPMLVGGIAPLVAQQQLLQPQAVAPGWYAAGSTVPREYNIGLEPLRRPDGTGFVGATIRGNVAAPYASGLLAQSIRADAYRGRRIRLTGWLRTVGDTAAEARLWMRVDGATGAQAWDYMLDRPIQGTRDWLPYTVVLDVPGSALGISFGAGLTGRGQLWLDDVSLETVGEDVPATGQIRNGTDANGFVSRTGRVALRELRSEHLQAYRFASTRPMNLSFEEAVVASR